MILLVTFLFASIFFSIGVFAQPEPNYNEEAIEPYVLPELLTLSNGEKIHTAEDWELKRRPEILDFYKNEVYGYHPETILQRTSVKVVEESDSALNGHAIRKQIAIIYESNGIQLTINVLIYLPNDVTFPPVFVGYNFYGNQSVINDPNIVLTDSWVQNNADSSITEHRVTEDSRGKRSHRWPIEKIIGEGFGIATIYYGDVDPDRNDFTDGIHPFFYEDGQEKPSNHEWGSISAWAWGLSTVLDFLKADELLHDSSFILFGHSRLGKTSLWAGALDTRFDMVISNDSGCGGAAIFRRKYGETAAIINQSFPHWFNKNFKKYSHNENALPVDQHMLIALIAPRPVYIASAEDDRWADPKGEYLGGYYASPVYELYGKTGLTNSVMPATNEPIHHTIGYHIRTGGHDVTEYDWEQFISFARKHLND